MVPPAMTEGFVFSRSFAILFIAYLSYSSHLSGFEMRAPCGLICISLMTNHVEGLFICQLVIYGCSLDNVFSRPLPSFYLGCPFIVEF
jgi:hypothetical protein